MGIPIYMNDNSAIDENNNEVSLTKIKELQTTFLDSLKQKWESMLINFPMIPNNHNFNYYSISTTVILYDDGFPIWREDVQDFYVGQELELLEYIESVTTNFSIHYTHITVKNVNGNIINGIFIGNNFANQPTRLEV